MKRTIKTGYTFRTAELYPRWHVAVLEGIHGRGVVVDHRFKVNGEWEWIRCPVFTDSENRDEIAFCIGSARSEIRAHKELSCSA